MSITTSFPEPRASESQPAIPGSYGVPPRGFRLPETTRLGPVVLQISDLSKSLDFYRSVLGLKLLGRGDSEAVLGSPSGTPLVELRELRGARSRPRGRTGLFHFALLLPDRASLGRFVRHLRSLGIHAGASDHFVSEALYLQDPDNLGIEVCCDRPRSAWQRLGRELKITTEPLHLAELTAMDDQPWEGIPAGTVMGHVHLQVGDLRRSADFFAEALGFDRMVWKYPGALFLGAGGYHHHLGTNVWGGLGADPPQPQEAQLLEWTIELPTWETLEAAAQSLEAAGYPVVREGATIIVHDPWHTPIRLSSSAM